MRVFWPRGRGVYSAVAGPTRIQPVAGESAAESYRTSGTMISLTRLNGRKFVLNAEIIRYIEETPDTTITTIGGEKILVKESMQQVVEQAIEYRRRIRVFGT